MTTSNISSQINAISFKATVIVVLLGIVSLFLPLEAPQATQEAAAEWLINDLTLYMLGWLVQLILMFGTTTIFAGAAWQIYPTKPLRAIVLWVLTATTFIAFIIPKFIALWSVPLSARSLAAGSELGESAEAFLLSMNPSAAFGLAPSLDLLGFVIYGAMGFILFRPLYALSTSAKVAALALLFYGIAVFLVVFVGVTAIISQKDIWPYADSSTFIFIVAIVALLVRFKSQISPAKEEESTS